MPTPLATPDATDGTTVGPEVPDMDVLTPRDPAWFAKRHTIDIRTRHEVTGVDPAGLEPETADTPFGERTSAGKLFGASGGVMEAAVRSVHYLLTSKELKELKIQPLRGMQGCKELKVNIDGLEVGAAVVSGLGNARRILDQVREGRCRLPLSNENDGATRA